MKLPHRGAAGFLHQFFFFFSFYREELPTAEPTTNWAHPIVVARKSSLKNEPSKRKFQRKILDPFTTCFKGTKMSGGNKNDDFAAFAGQHAAPHATNGNGEYYEDEYDGEEMDFEPQNGYHEELNVEEAPAKKAKVKGMKDPER